MNGDRICTCGHAESKHYTSAFCAYASCNCRRFEHTEPVVRSARVQPEPWPAPAPAAVLQAESLTERRRFALLQAAAVIVGAVIVGTMSLGLEATQLMDEKRMYANAVNDAEAMLAQIELRQPAKEGK